MFICRFVTLILHQDVDLFERNIVVATQSKHDGISRVNITSSEYYHGKVSGIIITNHVKSGATLVNDVNFVFFWVAWVVER